MHPCPSTRTTGKVAMARPHTVPPQSQAFIPLSEALTWADRRIALSAQQMVDEASFDQYEAETNRRRREVLHRLLDLALDGQLRMQGRPFNDDEDEVLTDYKPLQDADLLNFQRYDVEFDALRPGEGIACTEAEALSEAQSLRPDGFRDVLVNSRDLLEIFPAKRNTKKTAEFDAAERWLVEELAKDPHRRSAKVGFWEASRDAGQTFSRRIFERGLGEAWERPTRGWPPAIGLGKARRPIEIITLNIFCTLFRGARSLHLDGLIHPDSRSFNEVRKPPTHQAGLQHSRGLPGHQPWPHHALRSHRRWTPSRHPPGRLSIGAQKGPPIGVQKGPLCGAA